jgi:hypothetical protein
MMIVDERNIIGFTRSFPGDSKIVLTVYLKKGDSQVCITTSDKTANAITETIYNILKDKT